MMENGICTSIGIMLFLRYLSYVTRDFLDIKHGHEARKPAGLEILLHWIRLAIRSPHARTLRCGPFTVARLGKAASGLVALS
jgi:hypothetical protein